jgi:hypothetical protein
MNRHVDSKAVVKCLQMFADGAPQFWRFDQFCLSPNAEHPRDNLDQVPKPRLEL